MSEYQDLPLQGGGDLTWNKYTVSYSQLSTGSTTNNVAIADLPSKTVIHNIVIKNTTSFSGGSITTYYLNVVPEGGTNIVDNFPAHAAVSDTFSWSRIPAEIKPLNFSESKELRVAAISAGDNLDQATQGEVDIWVLMSIVP